jgi:hypothetical protein
MQREPGSHPEPTVPPGPGLQVAAEQPHPLVHADQAVPGLRCALSRARAAPQSPGNVSASTAMAALRPLRAITEPAGWVAAPHR